MAYFRLSTIKSPHSVAPPHVLGNCPPVTCFPWTKTGQHFDASSRQNVSISELRWTRATASCSKIRFFKTRIRDKPRIGLLILLLELEYNVYMHRREIGFRAFAVIPFSFLHKGFCLHTVNMGTWLATYMLTVWWFWLWKTYSPYCPLMRPRDGCTIFLSFFSFCFLKTFHPSLTMFYQLVSWRMVGLLSEKCDDDQNITLSDLLWGVTSSIRSTI